jgi:pyruvate dehydrogenase E2 component (dihydrolipoamide acetyltransferase)
VAVNTDEGLYAPVIHQAESLSLEQISKKLNELAEKSRQKKLSTESQRGATFTISNLGMMGIDHFIPMVDPSHAAIMGVGAIRKTPVFTAEDAIRFPESMMITISADHRVVDGAYVSAFLNEMKATLETISKFKSGDE